MPTPRVFIIRHGETEWSKSGAHTGKTDIPLTQHGEAAVKSTARALVGPDRLINPARLSAVIVSPRIRARRTLGLLLADCGVDGLPAGQNISHEPHVHQPSHERSVHPIAGIEGQAQLRKLQERGVSVQVREDAAEWDYGAYEGLKTAEITARRAQDGKAKWDIWKEGAPEGESVAQVTERLDRLIDDIRSKYHGPAFRHIEQHGKSKEDGCPAGDVVLVAHGHILRCFAARWIGRAIEEGNPHYILEAGGVGVLSYEHDKVDEPALTLGAAFVGKV